MDPSTYTKGDLTQENLERYISNKEKEDIPFTMSEYMTDEHGGYYTFISSSKKPSIKKIGFNDHVFYETIIEGVSFSSLDHPHTQMYLDAIRSTPINTELRTRQNEEKTFSIPFFNNKIFKQNTLEENSVYQGGKIDVNYLQYNDVPNGRSYLLRYHELQAGTVFPNIINDSDSIFKILADAYNSKLIHKEVISNTNPYSEKRVYIDSLDLYYYMQVENRGNQMILRIENTKEKSRNESFFEAVKYHELALQYNDTISYNNLNVRAPKDVVFIEGENEEIEVSQYYFSDPYSLSSGNLSFTKIPDYFELDINDEYLKEREEDIKQQVDSLLFFDKYYINKTLVRYIAKFKDDSTIHYTTDLTIYSDDHEISYNLSFPLELESQSPEEELIKSLTIDIKQDPLLELRRSKVKNILNDLASKDSLTFRNAYNSLIDFRNFEIEDLTFIKSFMSNRTLDEDDDYNSKYEVISKIHDLESEPILLCLEETYTMSENQTVKGRILESLAMKESEAAIDLFFRLSTEQLINYSLPYYVYQEYEDSMNIFIDRKNNLLELYENRNEAKNILEVFTRYSKSDSLRTAIQGDSLWLYNEIEKSINQYISDSKNDEDATLPSIIADYLRYNRPQKLETKLYNYISTIDDPYSNYLLAFNLVNTRETLSKSVLDKVCINDNYYYYILELYTDHEMLSTLPKEYLEKERVAKIIALNHWNSLEKKSCDVCVIEKEVFFDNSDKSKGSGIIVKCHLEAEGDENYYIGLVGNFDNNELFDMYNDSSGYFSYPQSGETADHYQELIDYYKSLMSENSQK